MTERVKKRLELFRQREYRKYRNNEPTEDITKYSEGCSLMEKHARQFFYIIDHEKPLLYGDDIIGFNQYHAHPARDKSVFYTGNYSMDYTNFLQSGLNGFVEKINKAYPSADEKAKEFYDSALFCIDVAKKAAKKYRDEALRTNNKCLYDALCVVPENGAQDYYQALVALKFLQYIIRLDFVTHVTLGRFDQYAKPYYDISKKKGATQEELLELTELFFLSLNFDSDIYIGMQTGDNGQSIMLGGCDKYGNDAFNELSEICLQASEELCLIDPKINLRVNKNTPLSLYERATRLTKQGLGFPQYSNDDIVIPGLIELGYCEEDARDYTVAACWEFIIPGYGADVPNIGTMNFPIAIERATKKYLASTKSYNEFLLHVKQEIVAECESVMASKNTVTEEPNALLSLFLLPCLEKGRDFSEFSAKYNNYGMHGAGISTAADSLEAIERAIFIDKIVSPEELVLALEANFNGYEQLQKQLLAYPKMGNNEASVDQKASFIMDVFVDAVNGKPNNRGGIWRAGTGSALEYLLSAKKVGATADGRKAQEPYASSFSPALTTRLGGPLSAMMSFTKYDMKKIVNGGPFTIEIHDTVFRNQEGEKKVAMLVKSFIDLGGHQMQINSVNRERLLEAQKHPELHPNLIVRVWGWSGYFNELNVEYQNHIIRRMEFGV